MIKISCSTNQTNSGSFIQKNRYRAAAIGIILSLGGLFFVLAGHNALGRQITALSGRIGMGVGYTLFSIGLITIGLSCRKTEHIQEDPHQRKEVTTEAMIAETPSIAPQAAIPTGYWPSAVLSKTAIDTLAANVERDAVSVPFEIDILTNTLQLACDYYQLANSMLEKRLAKVPKNAPQQRQLVIDNWRREIMKEQPDDPTASSPQRAIAMRSLQQFSELTERVPEQVVHIVGPLAFVLAQTHPALNQETDIFQENPNLEPIRLKWRELVNPAGI